MDQMEKRLAQYRAKKAREAKMNEVKAKVKDFFGGFWTSRQKPNGAVLVPSEDETDSVTDIPVPEDASSVHSEDASINCCTYMDLLYYFLWFVLWLILYIIFIELQFGTVFLIVSGIVFMYVNTRTGPRRTGEVSAYSVFNKNCESIDGTLKAEQFEKEMMYRQF